MKALLFSSVFSTILGGNGSVCCRYFGEDFTVGGRRRFFFIPNFLYPKLLDLRLMLFGFVL